MSYKSIVTCGKDFVDLQCISELFTNTPMLVFSHVTTPSNNVKKVTWGKGMSNPFIDLGSGKIAVVNPITGYQLDNIDIQNKNYSELTELINTLIQKYRTLNSPLSNLYIPNNIMEYMKQYSLQTTKLEMVQHIGIAFMLFIIYIKLMPYTILLLSLGLIYTAPSQSFYVITYVIEQSNKFISNYIFPI